MKDRDTINNYLDQLNFLKRIIYRGSLSPPPHTARTIPVLAHRPDPHADHFGKFVRRGDVLFAQGGEKDVGAGEGVFEGVVVGEGELEMVGDGVELVVFEMGPCFGGDFVGAEVAGRGVWNAVELKDVPEGGHVEGGVVGNDEGVMDAGEDFFGVEGVEADGVADHAGLDAVDQDVEVVEIVIADVGADEPVFALDDLAVFNDDEADGADAAVPAVGGLKVQGGESHGSSFRGGGGCSWMRGSVTITGFSLGSFPTSKAYKAVRSAGRHPCANC